jgi:copper(I)-binding protein
VAPPGQIAAVPDATAVGRAWTTTGAEPDALPEQCRSESEVTVYVVLLAGWTMRVAGDAATLDWTNPSDHVTVHGAAPVSEAWIWTVPPAHISPPPVTVAVGRESTVTVTDGALTETHPFASVTVSVYVVVAAGEADGVQLAGFDSPVAGAQRHDTPPEPVSGAAEPAQISAVPEATAVGRGFTVTTALPDDVPTQCASDTAVTVYVVVAPGETAREAGDAATPGWTRPSDHVTVHGAVPVSDAWIGAAPPGQIAAEPETVAVGFGSTVTVTDGALLETQPFASVTVSV